MSDDRRWMRLALELGARGLGQVWPNPAVGCVILRDGHVVGRGWTQPGGRPHAEVMALRQAGEAARGATAYVTLEPCSHTGKSGPCADALIAAGIARVVGGMSDPDPRVAGRGFDRLEAAGITVERACLPELAERAHEGFLSRIRRGRPMVTLKLASSLDGRIATGSGDSRWITGPPARRMVHMLRATHDAVLVGSGTALADDPDLRIRDLGIDCHPLRIVLDSRLRLPADSRLAVTARQTPTWLLHAPRPRQDRSAALGATGLRLLEVPESGTALDLGAALERLGREGITRILCEGGGQVAAALLAAGLVDRLVTFTAGVVIGAEGQPNFGALGLDRLAEAPRFRLLDQVTAGNDLRCDWAPV